MSMNDPIADFLTRIRNAHMANKNFVDKAPKDVVEECRANLMEAEAQVRLVQERLLGLD